MDVDPGSFRDPANRVFLSDGEVYRALTADAERELRVVMDSTFFAGAMRSGEIIPTEWTESPPASVEDGSGWTAWLRHERIPFISYPYEWPFEMLRDAARLQIDLVRRALDENIVSKDGTPYNVQFIGSRPVFIDVGSFEAYREGDPWFGYRQFCEMFLFPLMFQAYKDLPFQPWLRGSLDGITPDEARRVLSGWKRGWKGVLTHVEIHARAESLFSKGDRDVKGDMGRAGMGRQILDANLTKLAGLLDGLEWKRSESTWSDYAARAHYTDRDLAAKDGFVEEVAHESRPGMVWDIGANDGRFSRLAARHADHVVALDTDALVIDQLYRSLRREGDDRILPLVGDIVDPSPGLGWRGSERRSLFDRPNPDLVLFLAVIHHVAITRNVPLPAIVDLLASLTPRAVVEFPRPSDPMVERIRRNKAAGLHDDYDVEVFERVLGDRFEVLRRLELPSGHRILYDVRRR